MQKKASFTLVVRQHGLHDFPASKQGRCHRIRSFKGFAQFWSQTFFTCSSPSSSKKSLHDPFLSQNPPPSEVHHWLITSSACPDTPNFWTVLNWGCTRYSRTVRELISFMRLLHWSLIWPKEHAMQSLWSGNLLGELATPKILFSVLLLLIYSRP